MATRIYHFISSPDPNLSCSICLELASEPHQCSSCGKLFCRECIEKHGRRPCPNCRSLKKFQYFKDIKSGRDIKELGVRCANKERGCLWTGTVGTLDTHLDTCGFALVPCPNKCGDDKDAEGIKIMRKDLDDHFKNKCLKRPFTCPHCGEKGTFANITQVHDKICDKKVVDCPNKRSGCSKRMEREKTKQHVKSDCEYTEVACPHEDLGCIVKMMKKDRMEHENKGITSHFNLLSRKHQVLSEQHNTLSEKHTILSGQHKVLLKEHTILSKQVRSSSQQVISLSDQNIAQSKQLQLLSIHDITLSEEKALVIKLSDYIHKKKNKEVLYSPPFYTYHEGYKMCIVIHIDGDGIGLGTHVSVFTKVLEGHYDDQLKWPFQGTVTVELLNQLADSKHHRRIIPTIGNAFQVGHSSEDYQDFLPHSSLSHDPATNTQYLLDDTLYFRVSVKVDNLKPWLVCNSKIQNNTSRLKFTRWFKIFCLFCLAFALILFLIFRV